MPILYYPLRRMYQIVYHYDSHNRLSIIGGKGLTLYMMAARALAGKRTASGSHAYAF
jgi:hypothetical protein